MWYYSGFSDIRYKPFSPPNHTRPALSSNMVLMLLFGKKREKIKKVPSILEKDHVGIRWVGAKRGTNSLCRDKICRLDWNDIDQSRLNRFAFRVSRFAFRVARLAPTFARHARLATIAWTCHRFSINSLYQIVRILTVLSFFILMIIPMIPMKNSCVK
mgnify:CR=1 FL=1